VEEVFCFLVFLVEEAVLVGGEVGTAASFFLFPAFSFACVSFFSLAAFSLVAFSSLFFFCD